MALTREEALDQILVEGKATEFLNVPSVRDALAEYLAEEITEKVELSKKYNHMFSIAFSVNTDASADEIEKDPKAIPVGELKAAVMRRVEDLFKARLGHKEVFYEIYEAIGMPEDTYENEDFR